MGLKDEKGPGKANQTWGNTSQNHRGPQVWLAHRGQGGSAGARQRRPLYLKGSRDLVSKSSCWSQAEGGGRREPGVDPDLWGPDCDDHH